MADMTTLERDYQNLLKENERLKRDYHTALHVITRFAADQERIAECLGLSFPTAATADEIVARIAALAAGEQVGS